MCCSPPDELSSTRGVQHFVCATAPVATDNERGKLVYCSLKRQEHQSGAVPPGWTGAEPFAVLTLVASKAGAFLVLACGKPWTPMVASSIEVELHCRCAEQQSRQMATSSALCSRLVLRQWKPTSVYDLLNEKHTQARSPKKNICV